MSRSASKTRKKPAGPGPNHAKEYDPLNDQYLAGFFERRQKHLVEAGLVDPGGRVLPPDTKSVQALKAEKVRAATEEALAREEAEIRARVQKLKLQQLENERKAKVAALMKEQEKIRLEITHLARNLAEITHGAGGEGEGSVVGSHHGSRSVSPVRPSTTQQPPLTDFAAGLGEVSTMLMNSVLSANGSSPPSARGTTAGGFSSAKRPKTSAGLGGAGGASSKQSSVSPSGKLAFASSQQQQELSARLGDSIYLSEEDTFAGTSSTMASHASATTTTTSAAGRPKTGSALSGAGAGSTKAASPRASTSAAARASSSALNNISSTPAPTPAPTSSGRVATAGAARNHPQPQLTQPTTPGPHRSAAALSAAAAEAILGANPRPAAARGTTASGVRGTPSRAPTNTEAASIATGEASGGAPATPNRGKIAKPSTAGGARRTPMRKTPGTAAAGLRSLSQSQQMATAETPGAEQPTAAAQEEQGTSATFQNYFGQPQQQAAATSPTSPPSAHLLPMAQPLSSQAADQVRAQQAQAHQVVSALLPPQPYQPSSFMTTSANMHLARPFYLPSSFGAASTPSGLPVNPSLAQNLALPRGYLPSGPVHSLPTNLSELPDFKETPSVNTPALLSTLKSPSSLMDESFVTSIIDRALASHGLSRVLHLSAGNKGSEAGVPNTPASTTAAGTPAAGSNAFLLSGRPLASISEGSPTSPGGLPSPSALPPTSADAAGGSATGSADNQAFGAASAAAGVSFSSVSSLTAGLMPRLMMPEIPKGAAGSALASYSASQQGKDSSLMSGTIGSAIMFGRQQGNH
jgi:hypothetical protein